MLQNHTALENASSDQLIRTSSMFAMRRPDALQECSITHVLSVISLPLDDKLFEPYTRMVVDVDDMDDQNLIEHFPATNKFIKDALDAGGGVLVHW